MTRVNEVSAQQLTRMRLDHKKGVYYGFSINQVDRLGRQAKHSSCFGAQRGRYTVGSRAAKQIQADDIVA